MDSINCCDYAAIEHYLPGEFLKQYRSDLFGSVVMIEHEKLSEEMTESFQDGAYRIWEML